MKHKIAELEGDALNMAVALAEGYLIRRGGGDVWADALSGEFIGYIGGHHMPPYDPSRDWMDGGQIIERERIMLEPPWAPNAKPRGVWLAWLAHDYTGGHGDTALVAAMRAYVASKFGDEVEL